MMLEISGRSRGHSDVLKKFNEAIENTAICSLTLNDIDPSTADELPWEKLTRVVELDYFELPPSLFRYVAKVTSLTRLSISEGRWYRLPPPDIISNLSSLKKLQSFSFRGSLDRENCDAISYTLPRLRHLDLWGCCMSIHRFRSLISVTFHMREVENFTPMRHLLSLRILDISECTCITPDALSTLSHLTQLTILKAKKIYFDYVYYDKTTTRTKSGPNNLFTVVASLYNLQILDLSRNNNVIDNELTHLIHLTRLKCLNLGYNKKLTPIGVNQLTVLTNLEALSIFCDDARGYNTKFTPTIIKTIACFPRLHYVNVDPVIAQTNEYKREIVPLLLRNQPRDETAVRIPSLRTLVIRHIMDNNFDYDQMITRLPKDLQDDFRYCTPKILKAYAK